MSLLQTAKDAGMVGACWAHTREQKLVAAAFVWWAFATAGKVFQENCRKTPGFFLGGIGFHFFGIIHWLSLSTPSPWRVSHLVFLSTSTTRTNQKNAVVAVRLPQISKGHHGGWGQCKSFHMYKKTNLLLDSASGRCGSHREFCAGNQDVQNLAVKSRRFRLGC